jgi:predicted ester cyclase
MAVSPSRLVRAVTASDAVKEVVRLNNDEVLGKGNFQLFDELFANDFHDHTPPPGVSPDKNGVRQLYKVLRTAFPDFYAKVHWQLVDRDFVTTYKTYRGTHQGEFLGVSPTCHEVQFEALDVLRVRHGKLAEHWGVANLFSLVQQLRAGAVAEPFCSPPSQSALRLWKTNTPWQAG